MIVNVKELNESNFQNTIESSEFCLVDVWAEWCGPCKQLSPIIDEISVELYGKHTVAKLDADANMDFCKSLQIRNIPTLLFYKNGELVDRTSGLKSKKEILELVGKYTSN